MEQNNNEIEVVEVQQKKGLSTGAKLGLAALGLAAVAAVVKFVKKRKAPGEEVIEAEETTDFEEFEEEN